MVFAARTALIPRHSFEKNRRYAVLAISIAAALLTPTPDVVNMLLMGVPLYLLYEVGILVMKVLKI
jgi:sec-independent protein translocase protein TatC